MFRDAGFTQLVEEATRVSDGAETLIDHVYTTHTDRIVGIQVSIYGLTDHYLVCFVYRTCRKKKRSKKLP